MSLRPPSLLDRYVKNTRHVARNFIDSMVHMKGADVPDLGPRTLWRLNSDDDLSEFRYGGDADHGGYSTANLTLNEDPEYNKPIGKEATGLFWGNLRLDCKPEVRDRFRAGFTIMKTKDRPSLFGDLTENCGLHKYLALRVRLGGDPASRNAYYVNLQTEGYETKDVWQHRMFFRKHNEWEDVFIPFDRFIRTLYGKPTEHQIEMNKDKVKTIAIAFLGGNCGYSGDYELGVDSFRVVNDTDLKMSLNGSAQNGDLFENVADSEAPDLRKS